MSFFEPGGIRHYPAQAREVFDVSGAGDTAIAAMAVLLATGIHGDVVISLAHRAAGLAEPKLGTAVIG